MKHTTDAFCPRCTEILNSCHPDIEYWFYRGKDHFPELHISDGYRNKEQQEDCNRRKTSREVFPNSMHNRTDAKGGPCSLAMDVFRQDEQGRGYWTKSFFSALAIYYKSIDASLKWGGNFKSPDYPHFELK